MRFKDLFMVRKGEKVTEKCLLRVLVSTICSILLCMSCLLGTTWAWFSVSVVDAGNVIQIGPEVVVKVDDQIFASEVTLKTGATDLRQVTLFREGKADSFKQNKPLYVVLTLSSGENTSSAYVVLDGLSKPILVKLNGESVLTWSVYWSQPGDVQPLNENEALSIPQTMLEKSTEPPTEPPTEPEEETTQPVEDTTNPSEDATNPSEGVTDPSEGATDPSESATDPTQDTSEPETT